MGSMYSLSLGSLYSAEALLGAAELDNICDSFVADSCDPVIRVMKPFDGLQMQRTMKTLSAGIEDVMIARLSSTQDQIAMRDASPVLSVYIFVSSYVILQVGSAPS